MASTPRTRQAYGDYDTVGTLTRELIQAAAFALTGSHEGRTWSATMMEQSSTPVVSGVR